MESAAYPQSNCDSMLGLRTSQRRPRVGATVLLTHVDRKVHSIDTRDRQCNRDIFGLEENHPVSSRHPSKQHNLRPVHTFSGSLTNLPTISAVHPRIIRQKATTKEPNIMNGRRRPHLDRDRSAMTPIRGWMINPDNGPAIHTNEVLDFVKPS